MGVLHPHVPRRLGASWPVTRPGQRVQGTMDQRFSLWVVAWSPAGAFARTTTARSPAAQTGDGHDRSQHTDHLTDLLLYGVALTRNPVFRSWDVSPATLRATQTTISTCRRGTMKHTPSSPPIPPHMIISR